MDIAQLLIKHGSKINVMDRWKFTPLHEAAQKGRTQLCSLLVGSNSYQVAILSPNLLYCTQISHGADVNLKNQENQMPFDLATVRYDRLSTSFCSIQDLPKNMSAFRITILYKIGFSSYFLRSCKILFTCWYLQSRR